MKYSMALFWCLPLLILLLFCCNRIEGPLESDIPNPETEISLLTNSLRAVPSPPAPSEQATVVFGESECSFWPYTGINFSESPQDPINLIFVGHADPRDIRAALLALDGDRSAYGLPPMTPFNSRWDDALGGDIQTAFGGNAGWVGSCIQLACGDYQPLRIHMRLFRVGEWTIANAHFETIIPNTTSHQVLSWEIAEQFVTVDMMRTGLLDSDTPMMPTDQINASPFRVIPAMIYNELPDELKDLIGGPIGEVSKDVPIMSDGHAVVFNLSGTVPRVAETRVQEITVEWEQVIPKPFCASGPEDYVYVTGPVQLIQTTAIDDYGNYQTSFNANGVLSVVPINPMTGEPVGKPLHAVVREMQKSHFLDNRQLVWGMMYQRLGPNALPGAGRYFRMLKVGRNGPCAFTEDVKCYDAD